MSSEEESMMHNSDVLVGQMLYDGAGNINKPRNKTVHVTTAIFKTSVRRVISYLIANFQTMFFPADFKLWNEKSFFVFCGSSNIYKHNILSFL